MVNPFENAGQAIYGQRGFVLDAEEDLQNLPTTGLPAGSWALIIDTGDAYMLNSKGQWKKL